ncbi:hypothetical protein GCM10007416_29140 [Kroppenstedtia guangzhouensis]|uniref:Uncharacterized protein n=1 Tax=Kroppenstedtia guangzhouensis TaxID=1274356 RepID=A0ABQ1H032_9BACL|nr:hypothetical protein [Kroppenstedtia guangzhouensis]GGA54139.1 hypothetical protein GCM10007416_29140 [Kroppenstedtia guangzhouensis]
MKRLDSLLIGLLAASAVVLGVLEAAGLITLKPVYLLCYALAVAVIFIPGRGNTGRVIRLALIFLIFAGIPYGWEQWMSFRQGVDRFTPAVLAIVLGCFLFTHQRGKRGS